MQCNKKEREKPQCNYGRLHEWLAAVVQINSGGPAEKRVCTVRAACPLQNRIYREKFKETVNLPDDTF
jgi:hypothetical protein